MRVNKFFFTIIFILVFILISIPGYSQKDSFRIPKLVVFYSPTCHNCLQIKKELLPQIEKKFKDKIYLEYRDIADMENYKLMLGLQEKYGPDIKIVLPVFYFEGKLLNGQADIRRELEVMIANSLNKLQEVEALPPLDLVTRFKAFKPLTIIGAGLIDGINPCAFTVLVFFVSFLVLQGYRKRELISVGLSFIFAVFLTYISLGAGLLGFLYYIEGFWLAARIFNFSIGILSIILGFLAIYDFFKFKKTGLTEGLVLQLPTAVKNQIHSIIGLHYRKSKDANEKQVLYMPMFRLVLSALITGFLVSILEAVCTGQMYLPTITFVLKTSHLKTQALGYLLLYNIMFILPLLIIFFFALWGATSEQFTKVLKRHLSAIKLLMAVLFFGLGIFLLWRV
jgi:cytochrome c biogenesis protein CcdA